MSMTPPPPPPMPEPPPSTGPMGDAPQVDSAGSFFSNLFDISMSRFITPSIIKILYVIGIVIVSIVALIFLIASISNGAPIVGILLAPLYWIFGVIYLRVLLEIVIVLFRIERRHARPTSTLPPSSGMR